MSPETEKRVVRRLGTNAIHVAEVPAALLIRGRVFGSSFVGIETPVAVACGAVLRDGSRVVVCMRPSTRVSCRACTRVSGLAEAPEGNNRIGGPGGSCGATEETQP